MSDLIFYTIIAYFGLCLMCLPIVLFFMPRMIKNALVVDDMYDYKHKRK